MIEGSDDLTMYKTIKILWRSLDNSLYDLGIYRCSVLVKVYRYV